VVRLGYHQAIRHSDYPFAAAKHQLHIFRVMPGVFGQCFRKRSGIYLVFTVDTTLGLGNDFLCYNKDITIFNADAALLCRFQNNPG